MKRAGGKHAATNGPIKIWMHDLRKQGTIFGRSILNGTLLFSSEGYHARYITRNICIYHSDTAKNGSEKNSNKQRRLRDMACLWQRHIIIAALLSDASLLLLLLKEGPYS